MITGEVEAVDRKQKIRDRYKGVDISELEVIPAKIIEDLETSSVIRRVAAYIRVSTDNDEQTSSYELQKNYYTDYIQAQPGWVFVGIYADEGISGTSLEHRKGMQQLIEDCKAGKIDLVLTKSIARFARNIVDCLSVIELLKNLNPPVGVKFEADNIYTLDSNGRMILTILASVAEEESHSKSIIMNWSIDRRFSRGLFLTPALLGYDKDEEGNLVINPEEAQTVKVIYYLYLNGYSLTEIATLLMEYSRKTKLGRVEWNPGTLAGVLANERHCGDVLARKTFTPNFLTHQERGGQPVFSCAPHRQTRYEELLRSLLTLASSDSYVRDMEIAARLTELLTCLMEDAWKPEPERNGSAKRLSLTRVRSYIREMEARCRPRIAIPFSTGCAAPFQGRLFADRRGNLPMRYGRGETAA